MQKVAPSFRRLFAMVAFALSCAGLLLFLWLAFGGPTPLSPQGYRMKVQFDEATLLVQEAEVRISGLNVGRVKSKELGTGTHTLVELEIDPEFAPVPRNTRALLRQKSLLGQIYVELTPGDPSSGMLDDGETLKGSQVEESVELDEIVRTFDRPTRRNFQSWVEELSTAVSRGRGTHLNDAIGNLPRFVGNGADVLEILDEQEPAVRGLIRNAGSVQGELNRRYGELGDLVVNANSFFSAVASRDDALAETISILPTFLDESRVTVARLERFAGDTRPLVQDLIPVAIALRPTVHDVGELAPDLKALFRDLDPLIDESEHTLPQAARFLRGAAPLFEALHVYLPELNPILSFLNYQQQQVADFITNGGFALNAGVPGLPGEGKRHYLRQFSITNSRSLGLQRTRPEYERGNSYGAPNYLKRARLTGGVQESFDCKPTGGVKPEATNGSPPCFVQPESLWDGNQFPRLIRGDGRLRPPPKDNEGRRPVR
jgi:phospholipid/cholesterol/gamma-HCH transport system substrate-binding protein